MDKRFWKMLGSRKALSKMQAVFIIIVVVVAIIGSVYYYTTLPAPAPTPFSMQVIPEHIEVAIAGQRCVFLVVVEDEGEGSGKGKGVSISATAFNASVRAHVSLTARPKYVMLNCARLHKAFRLCCGMKNRKDRKKGKGVYGTCMHAYFARAPRRLHQDKGWRVVWPAHFAGITKENWHACILTRRSLL